MTPALTILRFARPYLMRYVARHIAEYLQNRRDQRLAKLRGEDETSTPEACPPCETGLAGRQAAMFTISGVLLGGTLGYGLAYLIREEQ
jgi:hypothetical protein